MTLVNISLTDILIYTTLIAGLWFFVGFMAGKNYMADKNKKQSEKKKS